MLTPAFRSDSERPATISGRKLVGKLLTLGTLLALNAVLALSPAPPPAIPPEIRLKIDVKEIAGDEVLNVYRAFEQAAAREKLTCQPTIKDYEAWREKGFEPASRSMVCFDSHTVMVDASWVNAVPKSITIDFRFGSQPDSSTKSHMEQFARQLEQTLKPDPSVTSLTQDTWWPGHLSSQIKWALSQGRIHE